MSITPQPNLEVLVANGAIDFDTLMEALAEGRATGEDTTTAPPAPPKVSISDDQRILMRRLAVQLAEIRLPDAPRELTEDERQEFIKIFADVKSAKDAVGSAENALKETFANDMDTQAKKAGGELSYDAHGHVLAKGEVTAEGVSQKVTRELRGGKAQALQITDLMSLETMGQITHAEFLAMSEAVPASRRVDPAKIMDLLAKRPELVKVLASVATLSDKSASYYLRKAK